VYPSISSRYIRSAIPGRIGRAQAFCTGGWGGSGGGAAYSGPVRTQRQVVDFALQRRALLADVHAGRVALTEVCDANPYLLQAARFHGEATEQACPLCRKERLTLVSWVFGDALRHAQGTARRPAELEQLAALHGDFTVHVVEVCRSCRWNHLVLSYVLGTGDNPGATRRARDRRRTAAE
jgi:Family of unknown function (DUF5318)